MLSGKRGDTRVSRAHVCARAGGAGPRRRGKMCACPAPRGRFPPVPPAPLLPPRVAGPGRPSSPPPAARMAAKPGALPALKMAVRAAEAERPLRLLPASRRLASGERVRSRRAARGRGGAGAAGSCSAGRAAVTWRSRQWPRWEQRRQDGGAAGRSGARRQRGRSRWRCRHGRSAGPGERRSPARAAFPRRQPPAGKGRRGAAGRAVTRGGRARLPRPLHHVCRSGPAAPAAGRGRSTGRRRLSWSWSGAPFLWVGEWCARTSPAGVGRRRGEITGLEGPHHGRGTRGKRVAWGLLREMTPRPWVVGDRGMPLASFPRGPSIPAPVSATCGGGELGLARFGTPAGFDGRSSVCRTCPGPGEVPPAVPRADPREAGLYP